MTYPKTWSPEMEHRILTLITTSWTKKEIALILNNEFGTSFTRAAVLAKVHQLKYGGK